MNMILASVDSRYTQMIGEKKIYLKVLICGLYSSHFLLQTSDRVINNTNTFIQCCLIYVYANCVLQYGSAEKSHTMACKKCEYYSL